MLEEVELELSPESGTGDDWSSLRKSKPPGGEEGPGGVCWAGCVTRPGGELAEGHSHSTFWKKMFNFGYGYG